MLKIPTAVDLKLIAKELDALDYWIDGSGALMAMRPSGGVPKSLGPETRRALAEIGRYRSCGVLNVMVNKLPADVLVPEHVDKLVGGRVVERWHLPVVTCEGCSSWWANEGEVVMASGWWWGPARYWEPHRVWNLGSSERVHLVIDLCKEIIL